MQSEQYNLENGMTVILQEDHTSPVVALQAWVAVGSADETTDQLGLAHVHEHMLFKGTENLGVGELAAMVESAGGQINAWTSFDQTVYHIVLASRYSDLSLSLLADALQRSAFDPEELEKELEVIQEEIKRGEDSPTQTLSEQLFSTAFQNHPYGRPIIGTSDSVDSFNREDIIQFYNSWYRPENITLVAVGDFDSTQMRQSILREFSWSDLVPENANTLSRTSESAQANTRIAVSYRDIQEGHVALGFHGPSLNHEDVPALELLTIVLGQGNSSILHETLKRQEELVSDVFSYLYTPRDPGLLLFGANYRGDSEGPSPLSVLERLSEELFKLRESPISTQDLDRALTMLESETVYERETVQGRANRLGYFHVVAGDIGFEEHLLQLAAEVTPEDIMSVARRYLTPENMTVSFVTPTAHSSLLSEAEIQGRIDAAYLNSQSLRQAADLTPDSRGIVRLEFPGGLTLLIQEDHTVPLVAMRAVFPGGVRFETEENNGVHNFISELLTGGTETMSASEISQAIESMAGSINGFSGRNSIGLQMDVLSNSFENAFKLFADCLNQSTLPDEEVGRVRRQILADIAAQKDNLAGSAFRQLNSTLFEGHPLQFELLGTPDSISAMTPESLRSFYQEQVHLGEMTLAVVGDISAASVQNLVLRYFDVTTPPPSRPELARPLPPGERQEVTSHRNRQQAHLVLGYMTVEMSASDRWPLEVLAAILSGQGGRLFLELRDRQSLAYSVSAFNLNLLDGGYFAAYIATSPDKIEDAIHGIQSELERLQAEPVSSDELERAQRFLVGQQDIAFQKAANRAAFLAFDEAYNLGYDAHYHRADRILEVTPEDIQRVARQYLNPENSVLSIVRPGEPTAED